MPAIAHQLATRADGPIHLPAIHQRVVNEGFLTTEEVLHAELDHLVGRRDPADSHNLATRADDARLAALCLSGGGIRSATFCLGALQALAARRMLTEFHYLSTVSGGGFAGGWLQVFIREKGGLDAAQTFLAERGNEAFAKLREYTNYLTPEIGALSKDTWAGVVLYIRNLILNWLVILPLLLFIPLALIFYRTLVEAAGTNLPWWLSLVAGFMVLFAGTFNACTWLPSHVPVHKGKEVYGSPPKILCFVVLPTCLWAICLPVALRAVFVDVLADHRSAHVPRAMAVGYFTTTVLAYAGAALWKRLGKDPALDLYRRNAGSWIFASLVSTWIIFTTVRYGLVVLGGSNPAAYNAGKGQAATLLAIVAPLGFIVAHLMQSVLFIGLRKGARLADLDREWVARVDGQILLYAFCWTLLSCCCLLLPAVFNPVDHTDWHRPALATTLTALVSGPVAAWVGKQAYARAQSLVSKGKLDVILLFTLRLAAAVFGISLLALLANGLGQILGWAQTWMGDCSFPNAVISAIQVPTVCKSLGWYKGTPLLLQLGVAGVLVLAIIRFGSVNVNRFSMHGIYRSRLTRGFLGSARTGRNEDPFTDFDEQDSPRMASLGGERRLFPIVNMTLNLTDILRTAWAERKAAPFTATPLACGSAILERKDHGLETSAPGPRGAYVPTRRYGGMDTNGDERNKDAGPLLGGLLTISGAAVSPNWGYHSSRLIAFLMTLFNVRLGAWMPNPGVGAWNDMPLAKPRNSVFALVSELSGRSTDVRQAVYLSDGGHFDNLGLYEALRRRCARIVIIDAGQDQECTFFDLGNAIRKAEVDGLASIRLGEMRIVPRTAAEQARGSALGYARGTVTYPGARDPGSLIYIKPTYLDGIPAEVRAYGAANPSFPHESTANQWFSESQFESYRALGYFQVSQMFGSQTANLTDWTAFLDDRISRHDHS